MIYSEDIINALKDILVSREETLAVAESVTAGHLQAAFSAGMDASKYFQGGITAYNAGQKTRHLSVDPILCGKVNCVSEKIANTMAVEVSKMFCSNYGIGITGYASIVAECEEEGLFAFFSVCYNQQIVLSQKLFSVEKNPVDVQINYTEQLLKKVHAFLQTLEKQ